MVCFVRFHRFSMVSCDLSGGFTFLTFFFYIFLEICPPSGGRRKGLESSAATP